MKYFDHPRNGKNDDKAHPPIHPVKNPNNAKLTGPEQKLFELVCRHFLAICSHDGSVSNT